MDPTKPIEISPILYGVFAYIVIFNAIATFYSYRAFTHYKDLFQSQHANGYMGLNDEEAQRYGNRYEGYEDEEERRYQE